jgi:hypothetical protein
MPGSEVSRICFPKPKRKGCSRDSLRLRNKRGRNGNCSIRIGDGHPRSVMLPTLGAIRVHDDTRPLRRLLRPVQQKVRWSGGELVVCDRWFPSTRTCHVCGTVKRHLKVQERTFHCQRCGNSCDRDRNAAANLAAWGERSGAPDRQAGGRVNNVPGGNGAGHRLVDGGPVPDEGGTDAQATATAKGHPRRMASVTTTASDVLNRNRSTRSG